MKTINNKTYMRLDADGESYRVNENDLSIVLNDVEHVLHADVFNFILCLDAERDYYMLKLDKLREGYGCTPQNQK